MKIVFYWQLHHAEWVFHYAITGQTAAEIVYSSADYTKEHMGLVTWKKAPDGRIFRCYRCKELFD